MRDVDDWLRLDRDIRAFEDRYGASFGSDQPDLANMKPDDCRAFENLLTTDLTYRDVVTFRLRSFIAADRAMLEGAHSEQDMLRRMNEDTAAGR